MSAVINAKNLEIKMNKDSSYEPNPENQKGFEVLLHDFESLIKAEKQFVQELSHALRIMQRVVLKPILSGNFEINVNSPGNQIIKEQNNEITNNDQN